MSQDTNVESRVDELSKPGNENQLNEALNTEFNNGTRTAEVKTAEAETAENKGDKEEATKVEDPLKAGEDKGKPKGRFGELLADRNEAERIAAEKQTDNQVLVTQVANLTKLVETLVSGKGQEGAGDEAGADDKPLSKTEVAATLEEILSKREAANSKEAAAEKSITNQIQALETDKETPNAKDYADELAAIMKKHSTLTAYGAYRMLQGEGVIPIEGVRRSNANRTGAGNRSKTNLLENKRPEEMTQEERLQLLKAEEKSGGLAGIV